MIIFNLSKRYFIPAICLAVFGLFLGFSLAGQAASAQVITVPKTPVINLPTNPAFDFLISWRANDYVPANYLGKIMPSRNSSVEISFDVLDQGKFVDLSKQNIVWYLGDSVLQSGIGLKNIKFTASQIDPVISISIPNYKDAKYSTGDLEGLITIPTSVPEVVINTPYPGKSIKIGDNLFQMLPYFFNILNPNQLNIGWSVDGTETASQPGNADILNLTTASEGSPATGANVGIQVVVKNPANEIESAQSYINLDIK